MKNIELKVSASVKDLQRIKGLLKKNKAKFAGKLRQIDVYYKSTSGLLKTRQINNKDFELIFYQRQQKITSSISNYYRIPLNKNQFIQVNNIFNKLFKRLLVVKKIRHLWLYRHTRIHLDSVNKLGSFLELETVVKNISFSKGRDEFEQIKELLVISNFKVIKKSYQNLLLSK